MSTSAFLAVSSRRGDSFTFWSPWSVQLASKIYVGNALLPPSVVSLAVRGESRPLCVTPAANLADFSTDRYAPMYHPHRPSGGEPARCLGGHCARSAGRLPVVVLGSSCVRGGMPPRQGVLLCSTSAS